MKQRKRRYVKLAGILCFMLLTMMVCPAKTYAAKPSAKKVSAAYNKYFQKKYVGNYKYPDARGYLYDFNKDGIKEMFVEYAGGARGSCDFYTYKNGKVIKMYKTIHGTGRICWMKGTKYIVVMTSSGANLSYVDLYTIKKTKMVHKYRYTYKTDMDTGKNVKCYKNGKRISRSEWNKIQNKLSRLNWW